VLRPHHYVASTVPVLDRGGDVIVPQRLVPVVVDVLWQDGSRSEQAGTAQAWTASAV
jgi:hypothetical protein